MARDVIDRQLTARPGRVQFAVATPDDDAEIRRLLRENPMPGRISISLEREPDYFADAGLPGETRQTIIARENSRLVCIGNCTIRERFVNGAPCRVGYLGGLRLDASLAGRFDILRRGYEFFRERQADFPADFYFTSIASDNERARWFLERGLPGMPAYEHLGDFVTLLLPTNLRPQSFKSHQPGSWEKLVTMLNQHNRRHQFAPCWSEAELQVLHPLGLNHDDFHQIPCGAGSVCAAIWDQRIFKQTKILGYASPLKQMRALLNFASRLAGGIRLPDAGKILANAFILNLTASENPAVLVPSIKALLHIAAGRGIEMLTLGLAAGDLRLPVLHQNFRVREYHSRLYLVRWPDLGGAVRELDGRILAPEAAWL
jgi:hypothetical protein